LPAAQKQGPQFLFLLAKIKNETAGPAAQLLPSNKQGKATPVGHKRGKQLSFV